MTRPGILNIDCKTISASALAHVDVMITDPPYSAHVHANATSAGRAGAQHRDLGFAHLDRPTRSWLASAAARVRRWSVVYSDVEHSTWLRLAAQARGAEYIRTVPWVRWSMPQLSGDRPAQGFEHLLLFWGRSTERKSWNGSGSLTHLAHLALRGEVKHKAEKPLDQALDLVSWFSDPGELVFDPFAGAGTFGQACRLLGRQYVGCEIDPGWSQRANARLIAPLTDAERTRVDRWLAQPDQISEATGPALERQRRRESDKKRLTATL
jgi:hypothetical protein